MSNFLKRHFNIIFLILVSLLPIIPFFTTSQLLHTHDGLVHVPRLAAYFQALSDGNFPVRFAGFLNYGYGLPLFNFMYQTPYLIGSVLLFAGLSLVNAFKISLTLSFVMSAISMYLFAKEYFANEKKALLVSVFYQFAPFRIVELLVRGSYGEVYTYAFFPLVLLGIARMVNKKMFSGFVFTAISTFLLVISHNSVSLLFVGSAFLFLLFVVRKIRIMIAGIIALFMGVLTASFYWVPAILEHKYTYGNLYMENLYKEHFVPLINFFIPNFTNDPRLQTGGISTFLGLFHITGVIFAIYAFTKIKDKKTKAIFIFSFVILLISFFFIFPVSSFIWGSSYASLLRQFQFPWRFLSLVVVGMSFLSVSYLFLFKSIEKKFYYYILIGLVIASVVGYFKAGLGYRPIDENYYWNFPLNTTYYGETDVIWSAGPAKSYPKNQIEIVAGNGSIEKLKKKNQSIEFRAKSSTGIDVVSNTQYYPGWKAYVDGVETQIQFQDPNHRGLLYFSIPQGEHSVIVKFEETKLRFLADMASIGGLILIFPIGIFINKKFI